uniref:Uncharacterized protein n=1 Tax=Catagonus wagneri TaxID=51154 RepID=A0A8C3XA30_9CETA
MTQSGLEWPSGCSLGLPKHTERNAQLALVSTEGDMCTAIHGITQRHPHILGSLRPQKGEEEIALCHMMVLELLVCPLPKKPLRYEASTKQSINEESRTAYPSTDGILNIIPQAARMTHHPPQISRKKRSSCCEQPSTKWTVNFQKRYSAPEDTAETVSRGRRGDYAIEATPYLPGGKPHRLESNCITETQLQD